MYKNELGKLIRCERLKRDISSSALCAGICSLSTYNRLELGYCMPDYFVVERIVERLGKSNNKIEVQYDNDVYYICSLRSNIEKLIDNYQYDEAEKEINKYERLQCATSNLHKQYIMTMKALLHIYRDNDYKNAIALLTEALLITVPEFSIDRINQYVLGEYELLIIILLGKLRIDTEEKSYVAEIYDILRYIEKNFTDEEVMINVYCKCIWVVSDYMMTKGYENDAIFYIKKALDLLTNNGILLNLIQLLNRYIFYCNCGGMVDSSYNREELETLKKLYDNYGVSYEINDIKIWKKLRQRDTYLFSEVMRCRRLYEKKTQETVAEELDIDVKTVSRIETGRYKPKNKTLFKIREYFKLDKESLATRIVVEDFNELEEIRHISILINQGKFKEAEGAYNRIKKQLSIDNCANAQYVCYMDTLFLKVFGEIDAHEAVKRCIVALEMTLKKLNNIEELLLSRQETIILNYIALQYDEMNKQEESIRLLETIYDTMKKSKVSFIETYAAVSIILPHLAVNYETNGYYDKAINICNDGIGYEFKCNRSLNLGFYIEQQAYAYQNKTNNIEAEKEKYKMAHQIYKLMRQEKRSKLLSDGYIKQYGSPID